LNTVWRMQADVKKQGTRHPAVTRKQKMERGVHVNLVVLRTAHCVH